MQIYMIRHGETDWNLNEQLQGQSDTPLNVKGRQQAQTAASRLKSMGIQFDHVISSPLDRAMETAAIISHIDRRDMKIDERLSEISYGPLEGAYLFELPEEMFAFFRDPVHVEAPDGVESIRDVIDRGASFLDELQHIESDATVLISTHGVAMRAMIGYLADLKGEAIWMLDIHNCATYYFELNNHQFTKPRLIL